MSSYFGKPTIYTQELKSIFCLYMITHSWTIQKHQALDNRLPGLLLQTAFYQCCETMRVHFMVLGCINRTAWGIKLFLTAVWASLVNCINSSLTKSVRMGALTHLRLPTYPTCPPPIGSICDIKKIISKTRSI